jgi:acetylcholinesterase
MTGNPDWYFLPVVDGSFSPEYLYTLLEKGRFVRVPVMVGDDTDEGTGFSPNATTAEEFLDFILDNYPQLTLADLLIIKELYPHPATPPFPQHAAYFPSAEKAYGEATFICPGIEITSAVARYTSSSQSWNYRYNVHDASLVQQGLGVPHVSEKPAIFGPGNAGACQNPCSYEKYNAPIVPVVMDYWISFILSLNPNTYKNPTAPEWLPWGDKGAQRLKIQLNETEMEAMPGDEFARCEFWKGIARTTQQ